MKALQHEGEIAWFADMLRREGVRSYLEIGSKFGGSLERVARALPVGSRIVSVDLPGKKSGSRAALREVVEGLTKDGYQTRLIWGDSTYPGVVNIVRGLAPFDAVFIDANHTAPYVEKDWENYGPMARIVAFHDVAGTIRKEGRLSIEVKDVWDRIKTGYRHEECILDAPHNGIGVLWRE